MGGMFGSFLGARGGTLPWVGTKETNNCRELRPGVEFEDKRILRLRSSDLSTIGLNSRRVTD